MNTNNKVMEETVLQRIKEYIKFLNIPERKFAESISISQSTLNSLFKRGSEPNTNIVNAILNAYTDVSIEWLVTGEGSMFKTGSFSEKSINFIGKTIPLYNSEASAGAGMMRLDSEYIVGALNVPFAKEGDIAISAIGNSMTPVISSGDTLVVRQRNNWHDYIDLGEMHVIVTTEDVFVKVVSDNTADRITLHSYNESFKDFSISKELIRGVFKLIGVIGQKSGAGQIINL